MLHALLVTAVHEFVHHGIATVAYGKAKVILHIYHLSHPKSPPFPPSQLIPTTFFAQFAEKHYLCKKKKMQSQMAIYINKGNEGFHKTTFLILV